MSVWQLCPPLDELIRLIILTLMLIVIFGVPPIRGGFYIQLRDGDVIARDFSSISRNNEKNERPNKV